jgi:hypothetical protein
MSIDSLDEWWSAVGIDSLDEWWSAVGIVGGFCNEAVYGRLNLLTVTGVVRLDGAMDVSAPTPAAFA